MEIAANAHLDGPLVNLTGLNGYYDFTMQVFHDGDAPPLLTRCWSSSLASRWSSVRFR